jgi:hypothetical protein
MNKVFFLICAIIVAGINTLCAQILEEHQYFENLNFMGEKEVDIFKDLANDRHISKAALYISLDFGERFTAVGTFPTEENELNVSFTLSGYNDGVLMADFFSSTEHSLAISRNKPESIFIRDFITTPGAVSPDLYPDMVKVTVVSSNMIDFPDLASMVRFRLNYNESYGIDCMNYTVISVQTATINPILNEVAFKWSMNQEFPGSFYQLQVLRLFNEKTEYANDTTLLACEVNWKDAGTYLLNGPSITEGSYSQPFTITEGTGFYLWRVRPVSHYHEGALANPLNYGEWSSAPADGESIDYSSDIPENWHDACFYFTDLQADRNYSYSRVFTENGNNKELVTYANRLNQVRQTATFLPTENVSVVTQTVLDNMGRPTLVTLPVPIDGKDLGYRSNFLTTQEGELYKAEHFDGEDNFQNPEPVSTSGEFRYYENNSEPIGSAQGYPYTRTIFYNDGSGRVKEQGGVGKTHRIHDGILETKKTTRYLYESATASELESLFGHEAPHFESVYKTITIDPNQVVSVSFINKEGQTIATGLAYTSEDYKSLALADVDGASAQSTLVTNVVNQNTKTTDGFIVSKRLYIPSAQSLYIDYKVPLFKLDQLCISQNFDCNYELSIKVHRVLEDNSMQLVNVGSTNIALIPEEIDGVDYKTAQAVIELPAAGTYVVQKELVPRGLEMTVSTNTSVVTGQVMPLVNFFTTMLDEVKTQEELLDFFVILKEVSEHLNAGTFLNLQSQAPYSTIPNAWWTVYSENSGGFSLGLDFMDAEKTQISAMQLTTPCCDRMDIPVNWSPPFDCSSGDRNNDNSIDLLDVPDFEGYMMDVLLYPILSYYSDVTIYPNEASKIEAFYKQFLTGWDADYGNEPIVSIDAEGAVQVTQLPGVVNQMIYHMLTDNYIANRDQTVPMVQYNCDEVFDCWAAAVSQLYLLIAPSGGFDYSLGMQAGGSVSSAYDKEYDSKDESDESNYKKNHDNHFDTGIKGGWFFTRWLVKRKISKRMRNLRVDPTVDSDDPNGQDKMPSFHLVKVFLDCAEYKFAKILTPFDAVPVSGDVDPQFVYTIVNRVAPPVPLVINYAPTDYLAPTKYIKSDRSKYFIPIADWGPKDELTSQPLFPNIRNPFYAFKYFYYDMMGNPDYQALESSVCMVDPNDCYAVDVDEYYVMVDINGVLTRQTKPCCVDEGGNTDFCYHDAHYYGPNNGKDVVREFFGVGRVRCPYTYESWSYGQRLTFYQMIANYRIDNELKFNEDDETSDVLQIDFTEPHAWYYNQYTDDNTDEPFLPDYLYDQSTIQNQFVPIIPHADINLGDDKFVFVVREMHNAQLLCGDECEKKRGEFRRKLYEMLYERCYIIGGCRTNNPETWNVVPEEDVEMLVNAMVLHCQEQCDMNTFSLEEIQTRRIETLLTELGSNGYEFKFMYGMGGMPNATANNFDDVNPVIAETFIDGDRQYTRYNFNYDQQPGQYNLSWYQYTAHKQVFEWDFEITLPSKCVSTANEEVDPLGSGDNHFLPRSQYEVNPHVIPELNSPTVNTPVKAPSVLLQRSGGPDFDENGEPVAP